MEIIKKQEYNKVVNGESFIITLEYGMKEDKTNHSLRATITHILDTKTGKKAKVYQDDITDLTHVPNVYQDSDILMKDSLWSIKKCLNDQIEMVINSRKNKESVENLMDELYEEGLQGKMLNQELTNGMFNVIINRNPKEEKRRDKEWEELML